MSGKSFYDLDYIIEINEQRLEQYNGAYETITQKLTNIIVIYSAMAIFLIPIVRMVFWGNRGGRVLLVCFGVFAVLFAVSCIYSVRLLIPKKFPLLKMPKIHYIDCRKEYGVGKETAPVPENLLKVSYVRELETALDACWRNLKRKSLFYRVALNFVLLSVLPYLICFGFYIATQKDDAIQKIEIVNGPVCK